MGFTTLDGLMMGTRSGAIDPGLVLHLIRGRGMTPDAVAELLNERSGLLGVSGLSADTRVLEASAAPEAKEALDLFAYRVVREAGSLIAALGGIDALVFTGGIGEHSARLRTAICKGLAFAGVTLEAAANARAAPTLSTADVPVEVLIVQADEEREIARALRAVLLAPDEAHSA